MFQRLTLSNFQSHKNTTLELSPGLNVITGASDVGKSSVARSLLLLFTNRPAGEEYKRRGSKPTDTVRVELTTQEGTVAFERKDKKNSYELNGIAFKVIRTDVPSEVSEFLNVASYNFQEQHEKYFLLQDSPGDVAKKLNELVGLSIIDDLFRILNSKILDKKRTVDSLTTELKGIETDLENLSHVDDFEKAVEELEGLQKEFAEKQGRLSALSPILDTLNEIQSNKPDWKEIEKTESEIMLILADINSWNRLCERLSVLRSTVNDIRNIQKRISDDKEWLSVEDSADEISDLIEQREDLFSQKSKISQIVFRFEGIKENLKPAISDLKELKSDYASVLKSAKKCPLCLSSITEKDAERIASAI